MLKKTVMQRAKKSADDELRSAKRRKKEVKKFIATYEDEINQITSGMEVVSEWLINVTIDTCSESLDLKYAGDKLVMQGCFKAFRKMGFVAAKKPGENDGVFTCYWTHPDSDLRIWFSFSSTVCMRVKVGTKMVEQDVYETHCG